MISRIGMAAMLGLLVSGGVGQASAAGFESSPGSSSLSRGEFYPLAAVRARDGKPAAKARQERPPSLLPGPCTSVFKEPNFHEPALSVSTFFRIKPTGAAVYGERIYLVNECCTNCNIRPFTLTFSLSTAVS